MPMIKNGSLGDLERGSLRRNGLSLMVAMYLAMAGCLIVGGEAKGQVPDVDVPAALECFAHSKAERPIRVTQCPPSVVPIEHIVAAPGYFGFVEAQAALDGLVELALSSGESRLALAAVGALMLAGALHDDGVPRNPGVIDRLERLFFSGVPHLRVLPLAHTQAERGRVIEFLQRVASEPNPPDAAERFPASDRAVGLLASLGEEGRLTIQILLDGSSLATPQARARARQVLGRERPPVQARLR